MRYLMIMAAVVFGLILSSCRGDDCGYYDDKPTTPPSSYTGIVLDDSTNTPIEGCSVSYEVSHYDMCVGWKETDSDVTDENGYFKLDNYYATYSGSMSFIKTGYMHTSTSGDTIKLSKQ